MFSVFVFSVYIEKNPNPPLSLHIYNSRASARGSRGWGGTPRTQREREGELRTENPAEEEKGSGRGPRRGCSLLRAHSPVPGVANSLGLQFPRPGCPHCPHLAAGLASSISIFLCVPSREQDLGRCLPRRPPGMKYCTRAKTKGESGGRGKLGCRGPPPSPCTSLAATRSGRNGAPPRQGCDGFLLGKKRGPRGAGVGVPGTCQHRLDCDCGSHESSS